MSNSYLTNIAKEDSEARHRSLALREKYNALWRVGPSAVKNFHSELENTSLREAARERSTLMSNIIQDQLADLVHASLGPLAGGILQPGATFAFGGARAADPARGGGVFPTLADALRSMSAGPAVGRRTRPFDSLFHDQLLNHARGADSDFVLGTRPTSIPPLTRAYGDEEEDAVDDLDMARATAASLESAAGGASVARSSAGDLHAEKPPAPRTAVTADDAFERDLQLAIALSNSVNADSATAAAGGAPSTAAAASTAAAPLSRSRRTTPGGSSPASSAPNYYS